MSCVCGVASWDGPAHSNNCLYPLKNKDIPYILCTTKQALSKCSQLDDYNWDILGFPSIEQYGPYTLNTLLISLETETTCL